MELLPTVSGEQLVLSVLIARWFMSGRSSLRLAKGCLPTDAEVFSAMRAGGQLTQPAHRSWRKGGEQHRRDTSSDSCLLIACAEPLTRCAQDDFEVAPSRDRTLALFNCELKHCCTRHVEKFQSCRQSRGRHGDFASSGHADADL